MRRFTILALAVAVVVAVGLSPFASGAPDGLERVAADKGFGDRGRFARVQERAPVRDYAFPGVGDARVATALAGLAGALGVFALGAGAVAVARRGRVGAPAGYPGAAGVAAVARPGRTVGASAGGDHGAAL